MRPKLGTGLTVLLDLEKESSGYHRDQMVEGRVTVIGAMPAGMKSGNPSIAIFVETKSRVVFAETTLKLLLTSCDAFKARYGDPRQDDANNGGAPS